MSASEFKLIERFFTNTTTKHRNVVLGIGDDAAIVTPPPDQSLAISVDTLICGVHFPKETAARAIGHKALAVNLSDMAAMAAKPLWATLALTLPDRDDSWLQEFSQGFAELAKQFNIQLIGGDTTRGPVLTVTVQIFGVLAANNHKFLRSAATAGDLIYITGTLGDAGLALKNYHQQSKPAVNSYRFLRQRLDYPKPRVAEALALRNLVNAAIDISDGLLADLAHILECSGVGATISSSKLPLSSHFKSLATTADNPQLPLTAGDDYELILTIPPANQQHAQQIMDSLKCRFTCIGVIEKHNGLRCLDSQGHSIDPERQGFDHFRPKDSNET